MQTSLLDSHGLSAASALHPWVPAAATPASFPLVVLLIWGAQAQDATANRTQKSHNLQPKLQCYDSTYPSLGDALWTGCGLLAAMLPATTDAFQALTWAS